MNLREDVAVALADHRDGLVVGELVDAVVEVAHPYAVELAAAEQVRRRKEAEVVEVEVEAAAAAVVVVVVEMAVVAVVVVAVVAAVAARHLGGEVERGHAEAQVLQDRADVAVALENFLLVRGEVRVDERYPRRAVGEANCDGALRRGRSGR